MEDGTLRFKVRSQDGSEREHSIDVLVLRLVCEELEDKHRLPEVDGRYKPSAEFLTELAGRLCGLGVDGCTPSIAYQLWIAGAGGLAALQKKTSETPQSSSGSESPPNP